MDYELGRTAEGTTSSSVPYFPAILGQRRWLGIWRYRAGGVHEEEERPDHPRPQHGAGGRGFPDRPPHLVHRLRVAQVGWYVLSPQYIIDE
jgi:hypothetical protein